MTAELTEITTMKALSSSFSNQQTNDFKERKDERNFSIAAHYIMFDFVSNFYLPILPLDTQMLNNINVFSHKYHEAFETKQKLGYLSNKKRHEAAITAFIQPYFPKFTSIGINAVDQICMHQSSVELCDRIGFLDLSLHFFFNKVKNVLHPTTYPILFFEIVKDSYNSTAFINKKYKSLAYAQAIFSSQMDFKSRENKVYNPIIGIIANGERFDVHAYFVVKGNNKRIADILLLSKVETTNENFNRLFYSLQQWCLTIIQYLNADHSTESIFQHFNPFTRVLKKNDSSEISHIYKVFDREV
jgi:hypothetical protein